MPGVLTCEPIRYTASIASVKKTRLRRSGTAKMLRTLLMKFSIIMLTCLQQSDKLQFVGFAQSFRQTEVCRTLFSLWFRSCDQRRRAAGSLDLFPSALAEAMGGDVERLCYAAFSKHDYSVITRELAFADHTALGHKLGSDVIARFKSQLQIR